jgi:hypothetical protein
MPMTGCISPVSVVAALVALALAPMARLYAEPSANAPVKIGASDIGGTVSSSIGPEAGVWVIAETTELPTKFAKIVVTDDRGRYVMPSLPKANYDVWVRGYGLVDSAKVRANPGNIVNLKAAIAPTPAAAAQYYPAIYWYSMLEIPDTSAFPGTGSKGNGMPVSLKSQGQWLDIVKTDGCITCHQLGDLATRTLPATLGHFKTTKDAWERRIQSGQASSIMVDNIGQLDAQRALDLYADWTDRIAAGELPASKPDRPQGIERNVVISMWDWSRAKSYQHDAISTDKRNPTVNANGKIYGSPEESTDFVPVLDPVKNVATEIKMPVRDPRTPSASEDTIIAPSPYWGSEPIWDSQSNIHNPMFDEKGRVWFTSVIRPRPNPAYCQAGSDQPSAMLTPLTDSFRQLAMYDPKTRNFTLIDTCFSTHHLQFANDGSNRLWTSGGFGTQTQVVGWLDRKMFEETGDERQSQGWTTLVVDTNGNGKRDRHVELGQIDAAADTHVPGTFYGLTVNRDGSVWGSVLGYPGAIVRLIPGTHPPATALAEYYEPPLDDPRAAVHGYSPRGLDVDSAGVVWVPLASGHLASFDRRKCKGPLNGPSAATGGQCPEGWTLYPFPGPQFGGVTDSGSAEASYYTWVDQHDTLGLGADVPFATGNLSDSLLALVGGKFVTLRVPYPIGFFAKGMDGRIDDSRVGWKGKGLWTTFGTRTLAHIEGGKGTLAKVVHFQLRPDPLAH